MALYSINPDDREAVRLLVDAAFDLTLDLLAQANKLGGIVNGESSLADEH